MTTSQLLSHLRQFNAVAPNLTTTAHRHEGQRMTGGRTSFDETGEAGRGADKGVGVDDIFIALIAIA